MELKLWKFTRLLGIFKMNQGLHFVGFFLVCCLSLFVRTNLHCEGQFLCFFIIGRCFCHTLCMLCVCVKRYWYLISSLKKPLCAFADTSRHYQPVNMIKQVLESMSYAKLVRNSFKTILKRINTNVFCPHPFNYFACTIDIMMN